MTNREWILNNTELSPNLSDDELAYVYCGIFTLHDCDRCEFTKTCLPFGAELEEFMKEEKK